MKIMAICTANPVLQVGNSFPQMVVPSSVPLLHDQNLFFPKYLQSQLEQGWALNRPVFSGIPATQSASSYIPNTFGYRRLSSQHQAAIQGFRFEAW